MSESLPHSMSPEQALEAIDAWLPPMGCTSLPEEPIKPAQANELHRALRTLRRSVEQLEAYQRREEWLRKQILGCKNYAVLLERQVGGPLTRSLIGDLVDAAVALESNPASEPEGSDGG